MNIQNALKYGAVGLAADIFAPMLTGGSGKVLGALYGLFSPDAGSMSQAYNPSLVGGQAPTGQAWSLGKMAALMFGAATVLPAAINGLARLAPFSFPNYFPGIYSTPFSPAGLIPQMWQSGMIQNWGACAGWLL